MSSQSPRRQDKIGAFSPINTLNSAQEPSFPLQPISGNAVTTDVMVREREPPRFSSPRKPSNATEKPPGFLASSSGPQQTASASLSTQTQRPPQPVSRVPHDQTLVAQNLREGVDPYAQIPLFDRMGDQKQGRDNSHVFNIPKLNKQRAEHHRNTSQNNVNQSFANPSQNQRITSNGSDSAADILSKSSSGFRLPSFMSQWGPEYTSAADTAPPAVEISRPWNAAPQTIQAAPRPMFSSNGGAPITAGQWRQPLSQLPSKPPAPSNFVDLTATNAKDPDDGFDVNKAVAAEDHFGSYDPLNYVDSAQANENIKALLEGAIEEDDEDKPKTRLRKKGKKSVEKKDMTSADKLAKAMSGLDVSKSNEDDPEAQDAKRAEEEEEEDDGTVDGLKVKLLPHQIDGVAWMLDKEVGKRKKNGVLPKGGILADDMGLGKTIQALSLIMSNPRPSQQWVEENPKKKFPKAAGKGTLVVAPLALIKQWESEIKDKVLSSHKLKVLIHHGQSRTKSFEDLKKYDVVITTYQTLTSEHEGGSQEEDGLKIGCFGLHWYRVILDEAHSIKNRNAKMTKAAYSLKAVYRWCLTGTPMQNNLDELQSLIRFLQIKPYSDLKVWRDQIGGPMKNGRGALAMKRLQYFLKAFMKRRTKDVLKKDGGLKFGKGGDKEANGDDKGFKIVARRVETVEAEFNDKEREFYNRVAARTEKSLEAMMGDQKKDYIGALVLLLRLRQICNHPDLIRNSLRHDPEALGSQSGSQSGRRGNLMDDDLGDISNMFKDLTIQIKKCDICQTTIPREEAAAGAIRCSECEEDLANQSQLGQKSSKAHKKHSKHSKEKKKKKKKKKKKQAARTRKNARKIVESDDEDEEEGDWVVPPSEQTKSNLGRAGGQDDEDAESGGEWLVSEDETDASESSSTDYDEEEESEEADKTGSVASTKIRRLLSLLEAEAETNKFIVFSEFTSMLDLIEPFLLNEGFQFVRYDGKMRNDDREASLHSLRNDPQTRILLCSLRCGSLGLNLTAASRVVILEPYWNPFVEEQAIDRVHRLNQTQDVTVYRLTIRDSVEERIIALQEKKRELAQAAIEGGKAVGKLSMKDILHLFRRDAEHDPSHGNEGIGNSRTSTMRILGGPSSQGSLQQSDPHSGSFWGAAGISAPRVPSQQKFKPSQSSFGEAYGRRW